MIDVVIGANYGDEGKGLVTDFLCQSPNTLVVKHNGGAQAGHTVVTPEGKRFVFHQIGSGTFRGAATLLSRHFLVNPVTFREEWNALLEEGGRPKVFVDYRCRITTPFDMLINRAVETHRGDARHGSCGLGINETVNRSEYDAYLLTPIHLSQPLLAAEKLRRIAGDWVRERPKQLNMPPLAEFDVDGYIERFMADVKFFLDRITITSDWLKCSDYEHLVFESGQGLQLDEINGVFPYVTRSRTGLTNVLELLEQFRRKDKVNVHYVTRTYLTRHGAGPLPGENPLLGIADPTNVQNEWQGKFRYAPLDFPRMMDAILIDSKQANYTSKLFVTHADQEPEVILKLMNWLGDEQLVSGISHGPTRSDVCLGRVAGKGAA